MVALRELKFRAVCGSAEDLGLEYRWVARLFSSSLKQSPIDSDKYEPS